jgi:replicative DNA helicase
MEARKNWKDKKQKTDVPSLVYGKIPPQALDLERVVLGALMLESDRIPDALAIISTADMFYATAHQAIFRAIVALDSRNQKVDLLTVTEELIKLGELETVGGPYYLTEISMNVVTAAHIENHCLIIVERYLAREAIRIAAETLSNAYEPANDIFDVLGAAETALNDLSCRVIPSDVKSAEETAKELHRQILDVQSKGGVLSGVPSGIGDIDILTHGWQGGELIVLAARPSIGKTAAALNFCVNAAVEGYPVAFFSLEMATTPLARRMVSILGEIPSGELKRGIISDKAKYDNTIERYKRLKIYTDYCPGIRLNALKAKIRKVKRTKGIKAVFIDYISLIVPEEQGMRSTQIGSISRGLKQLAGELNMPIILLAQLNRAAEGNKETPTLANLKESGDIEQDADMVIFISGQRPGDTDPNTGQPNDGTCLDRDFIFGKMRDGELATIKTKFNGDFQKIYPNDYVFFREGSNQNQQPFDNPRAGFQQSNRVPNDFFNDNPF